MREYGKMEEMKEDIKQILNELKEVRSFGQEIQAIRTSVNKINDKLSNVNERISKVVKSHNAVVEEVALIGEECTDLHKRVAQLEQYSRKENVIISGIPLIQNENPRKIVTELAEKIGVPLKEYDIVAAHRLPSNKGHPNLIARIANRDKKAQLVKLAKTKKPDTEILGIQPSTPIWIADHLTDQTKQVLHYAREKRDKEALKFVWIRDGYVHVRKDEGHPAKKVVTLEEIDEVCGGRTGGTEEPSKVDPGRTRTAKDRYQQQQQGTSQKTGIIPRRSRQQTLDKHIVI